jgi:hypothetical protein
MTAGANAITPRGMTVWCAATLVASSVMVSTPVAVVIARWGSVLAMRETVVRMGEMASSSVQAWLAMSLPVWRKPRKFFRNFLDNLIEHTPDVLAKYSFLVNDRVLTARQMTAVYVAHCKLMKAADDAYNAYLRAARAEKASRKGVIEGIKRTRLLADVIPREGADLLRMTPKQRKKPSLETRVEAHAKSLATRKARKTMGKKQRKAIRGVVPPKQPPAPKRARRRRANG